MIKGIVAVSNEWAIGKKNGLLFKLKEDMKHFQWNTTQEGENFVIMGENTLLSFPSSRPLKNRINIVMCPEGHEYENCICIHNFDSLVKLAKVLSKEYTVWIVGGGQMYKSMLPYYDEVIVTKVDASDSEATIFFPNLDELKEFEVVEESESIKDNDYNIKFVTYRRVYGK